MLSFEVIYHSYPTAGFVPEPQFLIIGISDSQGLPATRSSTSVSGTGKLTQVYLQSSMIL